MIKTKSIHAPKEESDGIRISVMPPHKLEEELEGSVERIPRNYDYHLKHFASPKVVEKYRTGRIGWEEYKKRYLRRIRQPEIAEHVKILAKQGLERNITFICLEENPIFCHRKLLAEECQRYEPSLQLEIQ